MPPKTTKKADDKPAAKTVKIPTSFITRPHAASNKTLSTAYMNPQVLKALEITNGSFILITKDGELNGVPAIVAAAEIEMEVIQVSDSLRNVCQWLLGDRLGIKKLDQQPDYALNVTIGGECDEKTLNEVGLIIPGMIIGDAVVVDVDSADISKLSLGDVQTTSQIPACIYKKGCILTTCESKIPHKRFNLPRALGFDSVGGLSKAISLLKNTIELPLNQPTLFSDFGVTPPRGILMHGPPGTGKTMLLRAVAQEVQAHVQTINGPSIVSKYLGETESKLRDIFMEARKYQPSIIFVDEIDSLAPNRNSDDSGEVESRVVATLLTLMDGMGASGRVVVVAATNRPNQVDPALRRPGRFDQEVEIGIPDVESRMDILRLQFDKMAEKHELSAEQVNSIASKTHGYVGADLVALCREAVMKTITRGLKDGNLKVTLDDVEQAMLEIRPSAMREIFLEMPKVYWDDIGGQEDLKQKLKEMIQLPLEASETFKRLGVQSPKGVLLYGPPGCSKTLTAKALATESGVNFLAVKGPEIFNKYVGESERAIREIFRKARAASPSIIFFDEIDALSPDRDGGSSSAANHVLTSLLNEIDGVEELKGVVIVAATNRPDEIDPALLRPGRLDRHVYVAPPDEDARLQILKKSTKKMALQDVDLEQLSKQTDGCSGAEVVLLCQEAGLAAIMENLSAECVLKKHFDKALEGISRGITPEMLEYYREFASRSGIAV